MLAIVICNYAGNLSEWHAASSIFIANAVNLMSSIKNVLKASKSAQELPGNLLPSQATPKPNLLPPAPPTAQEVYVSQTTPQKHIHMKYFGREAPTISDLCVAVIDHPTGKSFNLAHHISRRSACNLELSSTNWSPLKEVDAMMRRH